MQSLLEQQVLKAGLIGLFLFVVAAFTHADVTGGTNDPKLLLDKMLAARSGLSYRGSIVYEGGEQLLSYSVDSTHPESPGIQVFETLSGPSKVYEFAKHSKCSARTISSNQLSDWYNFSYIGSSRIAGRAAHAISIRPVDPHRLGYNFVIDEETGFMLRSTTMLPNRRILERVQFVEVSFQTASYQSLEEPELISNESLGNIQLPSDEQVLCAATDSVNGWELGWAPDGFDMVKQSQNSDSGSFLFTDGLSSFSLLYEPVAELEIPAGTTQRGATTLHIKYYSVQGKAYMVTFVGEVPPMTAERVMVNLIKH